jgi:hypothetical protein
MIISLQTWCSYLSRGNFLNLDIEYFMKESCSRIVYKKVLEDPIIQES